MRDRSALSRATGTTAPGFALPAALLALVVIAALAAGTFFAALQELRIGRNSRLAESSFEAAEAGLSRALAAGSTGAWGSLAVGDSLAVAGTLPGGTGRFAATVLRLNGQLFLVRSSGSDASGEAQRGLAVLARRGAVAAGFAAALSVAGVVEIGAGASLDGRDSDPPGWTDCPASGRDTVAGLAVPSAAGVLNGVDCSGLSCIAGQPALLADSSIRDSTLLRIGDARWLDLEGLAGKVYAGGAGHVQVTPGPVGSAAGCDRSVADNWGEPARPPAVAGCSGYFPVILVRGDLTLVGGRGQGVLLVDGDLTMTGGVEFDGAVLVTGAVRGSGAGGRMLGAVAAGGRSGGVAAHLEGVSIARSGCALAPALAGIAPVRALPERAWSLLY